MSEKKRKFQSIKKVYDNFKKKKKKVYDDDDDDNDAGDKVYKFQVLLPNGISVAVIKRNPKDKSVDLDVFVGNVKEKCCVIMKQTEGFKAKRKVFWNSKELYLEDSKGVKIGSEVCFDNFKPNKLHYLRLFDGAAQTVDTFENMWDLTPDTDLLTELPDDYTFETALADLIDNSLQAVWSNGNGERKLISVEVYEDKVSVFDTGPGMDGSDANSIVKWGKMGASVHRTSKKLAIGGKPPYLTPFFGMFGYGGTIASMHLGRHAVVSAKTKVSKKVYWLRLERDALLRRSGSELNWKAPGGIRDPSHREIKLSPHGSFTEIVMQPKLELPDIYQLQCKLKDIYFPYIQCDELSKKGRTTISVDFQINGINLAEVEGGEVAVTNVHSCNGPDFVLSLYFSTEVDKAGSKSPGVKEVREGNARLKCVYFPVVEGKESIEKILGRLNSDGYGIQEDYESFSRISIRRLGRLLPEARWEPLPFMIPKQTRGSRVQNLKRCCSRVKCFIDTDAGFNPVLSKTDLAPHHIFTKALKGLGSDTLQKEKVDVQIYRGEKQLTLQQVEREYQDWVLQMHSQYDDEFNCGDDEPVYLVNASNREKLGITCEVVRVHQAISWKGRSWNRGQKVKILKGACTGCHKNNLFATLEYFLLEGFEKDAGGDGRIICRPLGVEDEDGSELRVDNTGTLELHSSISLPIIVLDSGKCIAANEKEWNCQAEKLNLKMPSTIDVLEPIQCKALDIDGGLLTDAFVSAGTLPPKEVVAVLRPSNFTRNSTPNNLDQKYILRDGYEMCLDIKFEAEAAKCSKMDQIFSGTVTNTSRSGCQGLYIFSVGSIPSLFKKAGVYSFSFFLKNSAIASSERIVRVKASSKIKRWELVKGYQIQPLSVRAGSCFPPLPVACYDDYDNIISFGSIPQIEVQLMSNGLMLSHIKNVKVELSSDMSHMIVSNVRITNDNIDSLRPTYEAMLVLSQSDNSPFLRIHCQVFPGPPRLVNIHVSESGKKLLPKQVVEDLKLEVLDRHRNHVQQGTEVELQVHGFCLVDQIGMTRKVDDNGFVDLSGLLKVTEGYGKQVSLTVISNKIVMAFKKFQVEMRELRMVTEVPKLCRAGSTIKDIAFEVVNSKGDIDETIHDSDKHGKSHTLRITADFPDFDDPLRYVFKSGRCVIPSITLPQTEGNFCIDAIHCQHLELRAKFEINVSRSTRTDYDTASDHQASEQLYLKERSTSLSVSDAVTDVATRKRSALQHSEIKASKSTFTECNTPSDLLASAQLYLKEKSASRSVSKAVKDVVTKKRPALQDSGVTVPYSQQDRDFSSSLQTQKIGHGDSIPQSSDAKSHASGRGSPSVDSKLQKKQDTLPQTPKKQLDPFHGLNNNIFSSPKMMFTLADSDTCTPEEAGPGLKDFEAILSQTPIKRLDPNHGLNSNVFNSAERMFTFADTYTPEQAGPGLGDFECVEEDIHRYGSAIKDHEEYLKWCVLHKDEIEEELTELTRNLQASMELPLSQTDCTSQKEVVLGKIEEKADSVASIYGIVSRDPLLKDRHPEFMDDVVGIVALLATASTSTLSCSLAEYLGEDQMLAIVCQSSAALTMPEKYEDILISLAGEVGKCIKNRHLIICLDDLRAYDGGILETDAQRRLALPNPILPDGTTPFGFLGYAVNMIDIDVDHLKTRTIAGHGLRETLFYRLFGELQVYETKEHMKHARECITDGALSLDGLIMRGKGIISLGSEKVCIHFPIFTPDEREEIMDKIEQKKSELSLLEKAIVCVSEERSSCLKLFSEKKAGFLELLEDKEKIQKHILSQQSSKKTPMASLQGS